MIRRLVLASFLVLSGVNSPVRAEVSTADADAPRLSTSLSVWESTGGTTWSHDASAAEPLFGNPTSRLEYDSVDSTIIELRARLDLPQGYIAELAYGAGDVDDGRLTDADFVSAQGAEFFGTTAAGAHAFSETTSNLNGDSVRYFDVKLGKELYRSDDARTRAGAAARVFHWTERYRARGVTQTTCTAPNRLCLPQGFSGFNNRDVLFNDARWRALFVGLWGSRRLGERVSLSGELSYSPLADLTSDDRHVLRADLAQSPSFRLEGNGQAATAQFDATYRITPRVSASVGARYWWMEVSNEARGFTAFPAGGAPFSSRLNRFETERYGVTLTIAYTLASTAMP